jgi:hypothetical protein
MRNKIVISQTPSSSKGKDAKMVISHTYKYLFVELPHTASTAIHQELCENYEGIPIIRKHAPYHEFIRIATAEEKVYFVLSGIRNPLDEAVSIYFILI